MAREIYLYGCPEQGVTPEKDKTVFHWYKISLDAVDDKNYGFYQLGENSDQWIRLDENGRRGNFLGIFKISNVDDILVPPFCCWKFNGDSVQIVFFSKHTLQKKNSNGEMAIVPLYNQKFETTPSLLFSEKNPKRDSLNEFKLTDSDKVVFNILSEKLSKIEDEFSSIFKRANDQTFIIGDDEIEEAIQNANNANNKKLDITLSTSLKPLIINALLNLSGNLINTSQSKLAFVSILLAVIQGKPFELIGVETGIPDNDKVIYNDAFEQLQTDCSVDNQKRYCRTGAFSKPGSKITVGDFHYLLMQTLLKIAVKSARNLDMNIDPSGISIKMPPHNISEMLLEKPLDIEEENILIKLWKNYQAIRLGNKAMEEFLDKDCSEIEKIIAISIELLSKQSQPTVNEEIYQNLSIKNELIRMVEVEKSFGLFLRSLIILLADKIERNDIVQDNKILAIDCQETIKLVNFFQNSTAIH